MSLKKIERIKADKWFRIWDVLIYGILAAVVVALFVAFAVTRDHSALEGISVDYKGEQVFTYRFTDDSYAILSPGHVEVEENDASALTICFYTDGRSGYNRIVIDKIGGKVRISESDCSTHKDCVYTAPLSTNGSVPIFCTPHALSVSPLKIYDDGTI